mmetsp:Transcript_33801/g.54241  ORF Transcript_33801/g.54241 Transcript_33801/m.54241 type:complete len:468 (-) Transcript_33801:316-1719(-)
MLLRVGHGARLEPTVEHLVDAPQRGKTWSAARRDLEVVDEMAMDVRDFCARSLLQLSNGSNHTHLLTVLRGPHGDGSAPVPTAADGPIVCVLQPVVKALLLDVGGHPVRFFVVCQELRLNFFHLDKIRRHRLVDERRVRAPAIGVGVHQPRVVYQPPHVLDGGDELFVRLLDVLAQEWRSHGLAEASVIVYWVRKHAALGHHAAGDAHPVIVLAVRRRLVHHAGATVVRHVPVHAHLERCGLHFLGEEGKQWLVSNILELGASHLLDNLPAVGEACPISCLATFHLLCRARKKSDAHLRHHVHSACGRPDIYVHERGVDTQRQVRGQGPGCSSPRDERGAEVAANDRKGHHHGRVGHVPVVQASLEVRQRRVAGSGVRHHLEALVHEILLPQSFENPPHGLHVVGVQSLIVVFEVDPATGAGHRLFPLLGVTHDDAAALLVVLVDAHAEHVFLALDAQFFVNFEFHR